MTPTYLQIIFILVSVLSIVGLYFSTKNKRITLIFSIWMASLLVISSTSFLDKTDTIPPRFVVVIGPAILISILTMRWLKSAEVNLNWLIAIHILRIPVEIVLHELYGYGLIPKSMTYEGWNFDILSGISAIPILFLNRSEKISKRTLLFWNYGALLLLALIVIPAILSTPSPIQLFAFDQPNIGVLKFPYVLLPGVVVPIVLIAHLRMINTLKKLPS
jgi:hypothetical protein